ncbi:MAG TPA: TolC family protein [Candidatus Acidoferrales bacterium]|nr:TolC family protein [Candidatus Acidoferrales bacterium]
MKGAQGLILLYFLLFMGSIADAQLPGQRANSTSQTDQSSTPVAAPATANSASQGLLLGVFSGSGKVDKAVPGDIPISIVDAIDRGIRHNLGLLLSQEQTASARAQYRRSLSVLLPNISGRASDSIQQINLAAFGIPLPAGLTSPVIGPFNVFDARATMSETFLDFSALNRVHEAAENEKTARFTLQDARELVVLVVGNQYLLTVAAAARLDTAKVQLNTAQTIFQQTQDLKKAGVSAGIDVLRAQVQMQTQQQRVLAAQNQVEQQKLTLARIIGLPVSQQFSLTDKVPYAPLPPLDIDQALAEAYKQRPEYLAAESRVRSAELALKAAKAEHLPTAELNGDFGVLGKTLGSAENTYTISAGVRIPIFQGGRAQADVAQSESDLRQDRLQLEDLHNRVEQEIRSALLDVQSSNQQVAVAKQSIDLASEELKQTQDRFKAGVSGSLDVVQAQESVATANDTYIQALYVNNVAKLTLARALGVAEKQTRAFLGGK